MSKRKKLSDDDWARVFAVRCLSKDGKPISKADRRLCDAAFDGDEARYTAMDKDVFNATVPFGSNVRMK
jgi:hypothetical protein